MRPYLLLLLCLALSFGILAQPIDPDHFKSVKIRNVGPAGMSGRVTAIDVVNSSPDVIYIGTASGGVWKSTSGGIDWTPVFDEQALQSIGALCINQRNPDEIWAGTGEGNPRNSMNSGEGIYKSLDGGKTWKLMGLKATQTIHRIIIHRDNPDIVYVGTLGSAWGPNPDRGVFRTKDGGKSWEKILFVNDSIGCADLVVDPSNPNKLIAAMWEFGRKPWTFQSGGKGSGLYISYDGGETWQQKTAKDGLPDGDLGRMGLAIAPSSPNIVYALIEAKKDGFYKSTDGGVSWKLVSDKNIGNRPFYYADIFVDPLNENRIFNLWSMLSKSEDGGNTFELFGRNTHPDHHAFWVHPQNPKYMIEGNDGGLNISRDGGKSWQFVDKLPLAQFYHISYDMDIPYHIAGGMQDNGSWVGPSSLWKYGGIRNADWQEVYFGDGFDVLFHPESSRYVYAMSQGGNVSFIDRETGFSNFIKPIHPDGIELRYNWNAAIAQNPFHSDGLYFGSQFLHKSMDKGFSWEIISPDLTSNDPEKQKQSESGGLTIDDTRAENHTTILAIAPSPANEQVIWVGTDDGNLQLTRDGGKTWTNVASQLPGVKPGSWIPYIEVSQRRAAEAFVVVNDYRRNDWRPMVFQTTDYGATFKRIVDEKQVDGYALSIVQDPDAPNLLWLGTDHGLWLSLDGGAKWDKWTQGFPSAPVADLKIHPREKDLIIGTFGRAAWILDDTRPFQEMASTKGTVLEQTLRVFPAPDAYLANFQSYDGYHFPADAAFSGDNRSPNAMISVWLKPEKEKDKKEQAQVENKDKKKGGKKTPVDETEDKPASDSLQKPLRSADNFKIVIKNDQGDTIRNFSQEAKPGLNRLNWNLRRNGISFPSRNERKKDDDPPTGRKVLPGVYNFIVQCGDYKDSTLIQVMSDPRLKTSMQDMLAEEAAFEAYYALVEKASAGFEALREAKKTINRVNETLANAPDSLQKDMRKLGKSLQDSIAQLEELYMLPADFKGIRRSTDKLNSAFYTIDNYLVAEKGIISPSGNTLLEQTRTQTQAVLDKVNAFFANDFAPYQQKVESIPISLFKPFEAIRVD
ncbi:MAG TPA: hypothetical protein PKA00_11260 [Saprospiraceae bacterium]|nr:hypothetical protein [Saprospiraceae bacterium]HMQ83480.1 hypothetical protein [Saprospiraceae bacterium]